MIREFWHNNEIKTDWMQTKSEEGPDDGISSKPPSYGALDLIRTPNMAKKTCIITFIWYSFFLYDLE